MELRDKIKNLPSTPGIYMMMDSRGNILYIGKAKNLKNRVSQYFHQTSKSPKITEMIPQIADVNIVRTDTELDALIEECRLIKQIKPAYNRLMKSNRNYWYIKVTDESYPRLMVVKEKTEDGCEYFGPYSSSHRVENSLDYLRSIYPIGKCKGVRSSKKGGCLYYALGECLGVCTGNVDPEVYSEYIENARRVLQGHDSVNRLRTLRMEQEAASKELEYEKAARIRDYSMGLRHVVQKQLLIRSMLSRRSLIAIEVIDDSFLKMFLIKGNRILHREKICRAEFNSQVYPNYLRQLLERVMDKRERGSLRSQSVQLERGGLVFKDSANLDEAQIVYSYLKNNDSILKFALPSRKYKKGISANPELTTKIIADILRIVDDKSSKAVHKLHTRFQYNNNNPHSIL